MDRVLAALRGIGEETRLRILALCARADLTVSDLTHILGQSQPRISRHLKVLGEAGLLERSPEGSWVFYRLSSRGDEGEVARRVLSLLPANDPRLSRDTARMQAIQAARAAEAEAYFRDNAGRWDEIRSLHVDEAEVERAIVAQLAARPLGDLLDIGTGTGRMLALLGPLAEQAVGVDTSRDMLAIARATLAEGDLRQCSVRPADMYALPFADASFDTVVIHQVLHFAESPAAALAEAARVLRPGGRLLAVDFAPHDQDVLRAHHAHRRLGFSDAEVAGWLQASGLTPLMPLALPGKPLTVTLWLAERPAAAAVSTIAPAQSLPAAVAADL